MDGRDFEDANGSSSSASASAIENNNGNGNNDIANTAFVDHTLGLGSRHHPSTRSQLLTLSFNQDGGCLAVGTANGFSVHSLYPQYSMSVERSLRGGIGQIEMLFRCNLMALVGGGSDPHAAPHRVLIWDDHLTKEIGELSFRQIVLRVKLRKDAIAVALRDRVYVYHLADLSLRDKIYTADNPYGLLSLSTHVQDMVLACPSVTEGHVRVELYGLRKTMLIEAHESTLRALVLTADGGKLATASHKGTIVRVWDVATSQNIYEFRRGVERANITCLAFSLDDQWISCSSDKGTTHIFYLENEAKDKLKNRRKGRSTTSEKSKNGGASSSGGGMFGSTGSSLLSSGSRLLMESFSASGGKSLSKSICQIRGVPHPMACAFIGDAPHLIAVAGWDADGNGVLLISEFAAHQEARRVAYHVLVKNSSTADESEEERRRRRARGWVPSGSDGNDASKDISGNIDDARMHFGHLRISDAMAEESQRFQTQTNEDDFCEVFVRPRKEPVIEDKPPDRLSISSSSSPLNHDSNHNPNPNLQQEVSSEQTPSHENDAAMEKDDAQNDVFVAASETEEEIEGNSIESDGNRNTKGEETGADDKDSTLAEAKCLESDNNDSNVDDTISLIIN